MEAEVNILVTCAGRRVELVRRFRVALRSLALRGRVVCCDADPSAPALAFADAAEPIPRIDSGTYPEAVAALARKHAAALVVPTIDTELMVLAEARERIREASGARVAVSSPECVAICRDKRETARFLEANGLACPRVFSDEELRGAEVPFPLFVKPRDGSSSIGAFAARDRRELDFFLTYVRKPLVQELVEGAEFSVDAFLDFESRIVSVVPRRRLAVRGGEILKGRIDMDATVIAETRRLLSALRPVAAVTVQGFLRRDGRFVFTEVNPRFGGGAPMSIDAGADSCKWLCQLAAGLPLSPAKVRDGAVFSRFDDSVEVAAGGAGRAAAQGEASWKRR